MDMSNLARPFALSQGEYCQSGGLERYQECRFFWKPLILGWKSFLKHLVWFELVKVRADEMAGSQNAGVTVLLV